MNNTEELNRYKQVIFDLLMQIPNDKVTDVCQNIQNKYKIELDSFFKEIDTIIASEKDHTCNCQNSQEKCCGGH